MTTLTIHLPDMLQQRAEEIAAQRGSTIGDLLLELLEEYLENVKDMPGTSDVSDTSRENEQNGYPSLEEVVAKIKATPPNPASFHPATQPLAELLANSPDDPSFDEEAWNRDWAAVEAEIKAITRANDHAEGRA
jgi:predicted DNA-binding protein